MYFVSIYKRRRIKPVKFSKGGGTRENNAGDKSNQDVL
jgi:hypothetical protein